MSCGEIPEQITPAHRLTLARIDIRVERANTLGSPLRLRGVGSLPLIGAIEVNDSSRTQGGLICIGVVVVGAWFLLGLLQQSYWALAIPVAVLVFFALGLCFWVGYTIATIQVDPYQDSEPEAREPDPGPNVDE